MKNPLFVTRIFFTRTEISSATANYSFSLVSTGGMEDRSISVSNFVWSFSVKTSEENYCAAKNVARKEFNGVQKS